MKENYPTIIKFDKHKIESRRNDEDGLLAITPAFGTLQATKVYIDVEHTELHLILSWAVTVHLINLL